MLEMTNKFFWLLIKALYHQIECFYYQKPKKKHVYKYFIWNLNMLHVSYLYNFLLLPCSANSRCRCLEEYLLQVRHKQDWGRDLSFYYPRILYCLDQMLAVMLLSQHRYLLSKTVRSCFPCGARSMGHGIRTWSAVCSAVPH